VFFVRSELRFEKQLGTVVFSVTMQHVVVISYQCFGTTNWHNLYFMVSDSNRWDI